ncbi:MAG: hypothetical protein H0T73_05005 [Ardenticatenales bacterium]|nr:hypothetical protein [Ardenticatenales bacterium]
MGRGDEETLTVHTQQRLLLELASCYIPQSIALTAVLHDLAEWQAQVLAPETRAILDQLELGAPTTRWPTHVPHLLPGWRAESPRDSPAPASE